MQTWKETSGNNHKVERTKYIYRSNSKESSRAGRSNNLAGRKEGSTCKLPRENNGRSVGHHKVQIRLHRSSMLMHTRRKRLRGSKGNPPRFSRIRSLHGEEERHVQTGNAWNHLIPWARDHLLQPTFKRVTMLRRLDNARSQGKPDKIVPSVHWRDGRDILAQTNRLRTG